jgi:hypothetical protein
MALDHLSHQRIHCTPTGGDIMEHFGALAFIVEGLLHCPYLTQNSANAVQQPFFLFCGVSHMNLFVTKKVLQKLYKYTGAGIERPLRLEDLNPRSDRRRPVVLTATLVVDSIYIIAGAA